MIWLSGVKRDGLPLMLQPGMRQYPDAGQVHALDNGCFKRTRWREEVWRRFLDQRRPWQSTCLFAVVPDVLGDAAATIERFHRTAGEVRRRGYRVAFVAQDGLELQAAPWSDFDVLFIGGTTAFKLSEAAYQLVAEAKRRGKWVHIGRVNSLERNLAFLAAGADSSDGTVLRFDPNRPVRRWQREMHVRKGLGL